MKDVKPIGPLKPWACSYTKNGRRYGITLWATDAAHILLGYRVDGELIAEKDTGQCPPPPSTSNGAER
jgi:hypothetical protein